MTPSLIEAMRKARSLVSAQRLGEATRHIQAALSGRDPGRAGSNDAAPFDGKTIDHDARPADAPGTSAPAKEGWAKLRGLDDLSGRLTAALSQSPLGRLGAEIGLSPRHAPAPDQSDAPAGSRFLDCVYRGAEGTLGYKLYIPARPAAAPRALVVMLHGCTQDPDDFAAGTRMNAAAESAGAFVAYPQQTAGSNPQKCWNWFSPAHQRRNAGEPALIVAMVEAIADAHALDRTRIFAAGLSAGGAMAAVLGATYPDVFAAVGVHSGLPYAAAKDVMSALQLMRSGRGKPTSDKAGGEEARMSMPDMSPARTIVFHGDADTTVHPLNGEHLAQGFATADVKPSIKPGSVNGRAYSRTAIAAPGQPAVLEYWAIAGLGHAWSGGDAKGSYADPLGPDASREMLRFFLETRR